jgi:hypothetical protein
MPSFGDEINGVTMHLKLTMLFRYEQFRTLIRRKPFYSAQLSFEYTQTCNMSVTYFECQWGRGLLTCRETEVGNVKNKNNKVQHPSDPKH